MKKTILLVQLLFCSWTIFAQTPYLKKNENNVTQLFVDNKPYLLIAGEVYNSSASNLEYMEKAMKNLKKCNLNTVFVPISWEIIEPKEGEFNFKSVDELIRMGRGNNLKLVFLWLATWKNGTSPYAPLWVLSDIKRFLRVKDAEGKNTFTLSIFCDATKQADKKAYTALMKHLVEVDGKQNTVIAMQIENEVGVFAQTRAQTRDFIAEATQKINGQVPEKLIQYLAKNESTLEIEIKTAWKDNGKKSKGTWYEVFGKNDFTDLFFMAWHYASFINDIAETGKKILPLPTYVNCWMPRTPSPNPRPNYTKPGTYPSGGPIIMVMDIYKAAAPNIDIVSPDIYGNDFDLQAGFFHRTDNPLFIPETNPVVGRASFSFANHDAICFSPFGIEDKAQIMAEEYQLLNELSPLLLKYQGTGNLKGFYKNVNDTATKAFKLNDDVTIKIHYKRPFFRRDETLDTNLVSYGIFIKTGENDFYVAGNNIWVSAFSTNKNKEVWLKDAWQGNFVDGQWQPKALHNGDEASFLWSKKTPVYRIWTNPTIIPEKKSEAAIFKFKAVVYDF